MVKKKTHSFKVGVVKEPIRVGQLTGSLCLLHADYVCLQTVQKSPQAPPRALQRGTQAIHIPGYHLHAFVVGGPSCLDYGLYGGVY